MEVSSTQPIISKCVGETRGLANKIIVENLQDKFLLLLFMWKRSGNDDGNDGDDDDDGVLISIETGSAGSAERGESLPQSHGRHAAGEAPQSALGTLGSGTPPLTSALIISSALRMCCQR